MWRDKIERSAYDLEEGRFKFLAEAIHRLCAQALSSCICLFFWEYLFILPKSSRMLLDKFNVFFQFFSIFATLSYIIPLIMIAGMKLNFLRLILLTSYMLGPIFSDRNSVKCFSFSLLYKLANFCWKNHFSKSSCGPDLYFLPLLI